MCLLYGTSDCTLSAPSELGFGELNHVLKGPVLHCYYLWPITYECEKIHYNSDVDQKYIYITVVQYVCI